MKTLIAAALATAIAAPALASDQLAGHLGVEPGTYSTAELAAIWGSYDTDTGFLFPVEDNNVVSSQSTGFSPAHIQLAGLLDVNPADYSVAELAAIVGTYDSDTGYNFGVVGNDVVSSQSVGISAGHAQLAAQFDVDPREFSVNEILAIAGERDNAND